MKVLLVNYEYPPAGGGAANATYFMARALAALGHEPTVLTGKLDGHPSFHESDGVRVHRVACLRKSPDRSNMIEMASFLLAALRHSRRIVSDARIEGVIAFFTIPSGPVAWWLKRRSGIPYVVSLRGGDVPGLVKSIGLAHRLLTPLRRAVLRRAEAVVANAPDLARLSEAADPVRVLVIANGVDSNFFHPAERAAAPEVFSILFIGRLHDQKRVDILLRAAAELRRSDVEFRLDIVGDGPLRPELEKLADSLGVLDRVRWHGWLSKDEVASLYRGASCFVNPSQYEGMPNTVLEAMASGLPVVASDIAGNNDLVVDGGSGFLFELTDVVTLADRLRILAGDSALAARMGRRGRDRVVDSHSWQSVARQYVELLFPSREREGLENAASGP